MSKSAIQFRFILYISSLVFALATCPSVQPLEYRVKQNKSFAMFVFGDSVYDPGNNNYLECTIDGKADFPPYGVTFFEHPTGRHCDGRVLPDLAASYAGLPYWKPFLDPCNDNYTVGANFASAGSAVLVDINNNTLNLELQVLSFQKVASVLKQQLGEENAKELLKNSIYLSSLAGVDYMAYSPTSTSNSLKVMEMEEYVNIVIGNITDAVRVIYKEGGRKFAFQNVAPLGCEPTQKETYNTTDCVEFLQKLAIMHNDALNIIAEELASELPGFKYLIFDYFSAIFDRIKNSTKYGFEQGTVACCGSGEYRGEDSCGRTSSYQVCSDPDDYVFFDGGHPSEAVNKQLIELLWNGTTDVTWPLNLRELIELEIESETELFSL